MITLAYGALWVFIFSLPWESVITLPGIAIVTRSAGMLALGLALLAVVVSGRVRRWHLFHVAALLFLIWDGAGLLVLRIVGVPQKYWTYVQLMLVVWMIWELAPTRQRQLGLFTAYVLGAYVAALDTIIVYRRSAGSTLRFAAGTFDPNDLAMTLALGLPMAWYLAMTYRRPLLRWVCRGYVPLGLVAIGLTGSRGGMVASMVALMIVPMTMTKLSPGRLVIAIIILAVSGTLAVSFVPERIVARLSTTGTEVEDLRFGGRFKLWVAGMHAFTQRPIMGYGTSSFKGAITPELGSVSQVAHNSYISVLVEQGIVGFLLYGTMVMAVFLSVLKLPLLERRFALVLLATLGIAMLPLTWEDRKPVWFILAALLGLSQAYAARASAEHRVPSSGSAGTAPMPPMSRPRPVSRLGPR